MRTLLTASLIRARQAAHEAYQRELTRWFIIAPYMKRGRREQPPKLPAAFRLETLSDGERYSRRQG